MIFRRALISWLSSRRSVYTVYMLLSPQYSWRGERTFFTRATRDGTFQRLREEEEGLLVWIKMLFDKEERRFRDVYI